MSDNLKVALLAIVCTVVFVVVLVAGIIDRMIESLEQAELPPLAPKPEPKPEPKPKPKPENKILPDCINALIALGYQKRESQRMAKDFFNSNQASSLDEFITKIHKR
jgi:Holliday junction resolvasome RuvABC DNA-binding subunit